MIMPAMLIDNSLRGKGSSLMPDQHYLKRQYAAKGSSDRIKKVA